MDSFQDQKKREDRLRYWDDVGLSVVLPPDGTPAISTNPPGWLDPNTGRMTAVALAPELNWKTQVCANAHSQTTLFYNGRPVLIDANVAPLIEALWQCSYVALASCEGRDSDAASGYIMFSEAIGKDFMFWVQAHAHLLPKALARRFKLVLQPDDWHDWMADRFPLLEPVAPDSGGRVFTVVWRFHRHELLEHRDQLVRLLSAQDLVHGASLHCEFVA
jgi:hypothetical protein